MNNIPRWNLDSIYPDINSQKYKDALAELEQGIKKLNKLNAVFQNIQPSLYKIQTLLA